MRGSHARPRRGLPRSGSGSRRGIGFPAREGRHTHRLRYEGPVCFNPKTSTRSAHPEYPSGHSTVSGAAANALAAYFGNEVAFPLGSETLPGVQRSYGSFTQAADEANNSRVYGGIHFRSACRDGRAVGDLIGSFVSANVAQSLHGERLGQTSHDHPSGDVGGGN